MISEDDFMNTYKPIQAGGEGEFALESAEEAIQLAQKHGLSSSHIWTIMDSDEDDTLYVSAGFHWVNQSGYIVTYKPWASGLEDGIWMEGEAA